MALKFNRTCKVRKKTINKKQLCMIFHEKSIGEEIRIKN